jgi:hypothetical protein
MKKAGIIFQLFPDGSKAWQKSHRKVAKNNDE